MQDYKFRTDRNGFMITKESAESINSESNYEKWCFLGASFIESLYTKDGFRFTDFMKKRCIETGITVSLLNGGYSGATTLHKVNFND